MARQSRERDGSACYRCVDLGSVPKSTWGAGEGHTDGATESLSDRKGWQQQAVLLQSTSGC